ncbi:hypothetical protein NSMM_260006 [Nitrosomonas mobilis]|uniref:Uncharacterized protein n=1 Tax=Nitrosomonas mobilis TaxID=51642 RepID=A0A1G5SD00_9PROT|nr:hypothetical protein NSMM_260006 [Nitrosomonas mobilis]
MVSLQAKFSALRLTGYIFAASPDLFKNA